MQAPTGPPPNPQHPSQFSAELPSQWQGESNPNGPANTQFRHELPGQRPQYTPPQSYQVATWNPFSIATDSDSLSSGFPYHAKLRDLRVTPDQWVQFTTEVVSAAKLTFSEDAAAWTAGVATGTLSSPFLLVFAPVVGYYTGKSVHKKTVAKKVREKLAQEGPLRSVLRQWNEGFFMERGIQLWLEPPTENGEVIVDAPEGATHDQIVKAAKKQARRFRFVVMPYDPRSPVMGANISPVQSQPSWSPNQSPISPSGGPVYVNEGKWNAQQQAVEVPATQVGERPSELPAGHGKGYNPFCSNTYELDGSSPAVAK